MKWKEVMGGRETRLSFCSLSLSFIDNFQERLVSLVAQSTSLESLSMRYCNMDDACVSMLCDVLVKYPNCKLRVLDLEGNLQIPEVGKCRWN